MADAPAPWAWRSLAPGTSPAAMLAALNEKMPALAGTVRTLGTGVAAAQGAAGVDPTVRAYFAPGGTLVTGLAPGATVAGAPAAVVAAAAAIDFRDAFDTLPSGDRYHAQVGAGTLQLELTGGVTGGHTARCTGPVYRVFAYPMAFNPARLYRVTARVRQLSAGAGETPWWYAGLVPYAADRVTPLNRSGGAANLDDLDQPAWVAARAVLEPPTWVEVVGWVRGVAAAGTMVPFGPAPDPRAPAPLPAGTCYLAPAFAANVLGPTSVAEIDVLELAEFDEVAAARLYAALDAAGRVQTGVNANADVAGVFAGLLASVVDGNGDIRATAITPGFIQTPMIGANQVIAAHIQSITLAVLQASVGSLSALSANLGYVVAGMLESSDGSFGIRLSANVPRPAYWRFWIDPFAVGTDFVLRFTSFGIRGDGSVYLDPQYVPAPAGTTAFSTVTHAVDPQAGTASVTYTPDPAYAGMTVGCTVQLGGSTTTAAPTQSGTTFTYAPPDLYSGTQANQRGIRFVLTGTIPGGAPVQRPVAFTYPTATPGSPL